MAAGNNPTLLDPKRLCGPTLLTTSIVTLYTAAAGEAGTRVGSILLTNVGLRDFDKVWDRDISSGYNDETTDAADADAADVTIFRTDAQTQGDEFYVGKGQKFSHIAFILSTVLAGATVTLVVAYWNGAAWTTMTAAANNLSDGTTVLKQSGEISFTPPSDWATTAVNASTQYWIRLTLGTANPGTAPVGTQVRCGTRTNPLVYLYQVASGGSADQDDLLANEMPVQALGGQPVPVPLGDMFILDASEFLSGKCNVENQVNVRAYGIEMKD